MENFFTDFLQPWATVMKDAWLYWNDSIQRSVFFMDTLRERGNIYLNHLASGRPPVLIFDYEIIMNGEDMVPPSNYKLARIIPPEGVFVNPRKRPIIIIDPRAGHGPGIGGSKRDSEIGIALEAGHPVYFILFDSYPVPAQTIADVERAEIKFIEAVVRRHPTSPRPAVIGNCQAGWALVMLSADRPGTTGPIVLNGSPLSYWAGIEGRDTMRYMGGLLGGSWLSAFLSDLGGGIFDGANLVMNFELLNWGNTFWKKQYHLYRNADTEKERYLEFERWWNGFFHMTKAETVFIINNLFIGNKLEKGGVRLNEDKLLDLRDIKDPVVIFCSGGDNITPPQQAMNWVIRIWESTGEVKRRQQVIVYVLHKSIGHLGIFVSGKVAKKEHKEIMASYDMIEYLPPGIYEMVIENDQNSSSGSPEYLVRFEERRLEDILLLNGNTIEEDNFPLAAAVSDRNYRFYEAFVSPFVKMVSNPLMGYFLRQIHPLRVSRYVFSDMNPFMFPAKSAAPIMQENRTRVSEDNFFLNIEKILSEHIVQTLDAMNAYRSGLGEAVFKTLYGSFSPLNYFFPEIKEKLTVQAFIEKRRARREFKKADRARWMKAMTQGGFAEGLTRVLLAIGTADGLLNRNEFEKFQEIAKNHPRLKGIRVQDFRRIAREQARILQTDKYWAVKTSAQLLPMPEDREEAIKICGEVFQDNELAKETAELVRMLSINAPSIPEDFELKNAA
jgi:pimeloyl-ACP methyl ester carboxylesterase